MQKVLIYADGSSIGNPGPGGWGVIIASMEEVKELGGREEYTTNNRMELLAAIQALKNVPKDAEVELCTDSKYLIKGITEWVENWKSNGWKTASKSPVENQDLWQKLLAAKDGRAINWVYVKAHAGVPGNERVDEIAQEFGREGEPGLYSGSRGKYGIDLETGETKRAFYVSFTNGVFLHHETWQECERQVKGVPGAKFKKISSGSEAEKLENKWRADAER